MITLFEYFKSACESLFWGKQSVSTKITNDSAKTSQELSYEPDNDSESDAGSDTDTDTDDDVDMGVSLDTKSETNGTDEKKDTPITGLSIETQLDEMEMEMEMEMDEQPVTIDMNTCDNTSGFHKTVVTEQKNGQKSTKTVMVGNYEIYQNQQLVTETIINDFSKEDRSGILFAEFQAGKTGVAVYVAQQALIRLNLDMVILICGMADNSLKDQCCARFNGLPEVVILFNPDLQKYNKKTTSLKNKKVLVIHDESQYGSARDQQIHMFLKNVVGIDPAIHSDKWDNKHGYLLSVSATPFTEQAANELFKPQRRVYKLVPGVDYIGVKYLFNNGFIKQAFTLKTAEDYGNLVKELKFDKNGYYVVRLISLSYYDDCKKYIIKEKGFTEENFINLHSLEAKDTLNINHHLNVKPDKPKVIFVYASLTAGHTINKEHVIAMFEAPSKITANETITQRFIGRVCGYYKHSPPVIYTSIDEAKEYIDFLETNNYPDSCKYVYTKTKQGYSEVKNQSILIDIRGLIDNNGKKMLDVILEKPKKARDYLKENAGVLQKRMPADLKGILDEKYVSMGVSSFSRKQDGKINHPGIFSKYWKPVIKAHEEGKRVYNSHRKLENGEVPKFQKYICVNGDIQDSKYYGHILIMSVDDCELSKCYYGVRVESMYHINNSIVQKIMTITSMPTNKIALKLKVGTSVIPICSAQSQKKIPILKKKVQKIPLKKKQLAPAPAPVPVQEDIKDVSWCTHIGDKYCVKCENCHNTVKGSNFEIDQTTPIPKPVCPKCKYVISK